MTPGSNYFIFSFAFYVSIALMQSVPSQDSSLLFFINFIFSVVLIQMSWRESNGNFGKVYFSERYINQHLTKDMFAGFEIIRSEDPEGKLAEFEADSIKKMGMIRSFLRNILIGGAYFSAMMLMFRDDPITLIYSMGLPMVSLIMLSLFNYWGLYLFGLFYFLCYFAYFQELIFPYGHITCIVFFFLFFLNLNFLNNWYWAKLAKHDLKDFFSDISSFFFPFVIFTLLFIGTDHLLDKDQSFWSRFSKIKATESLFKSTDMNEARELVEKIDIIDPRELDRLGDSKYQRYQTNLEKLDKEIFDLKVKVAPKKEDFDTLMKLADEKVQLLESLQKEVEKDLIQTPSGSFKARKLRSFGQKLGTDVKVSMDKIDWKQTAQEFGNAMKDPAFKKGLSQSTRNKIRALQNSTQGPSNLEQLQQNIEDGFPENKNLQQDLNQLRELMNQSSEGDPQFTQKVEAIREKIHEEMARDVKRSSHQDGVENIKNFAKEPIVDEEQFKENLEQVKQNLKTQINDRPETVREFEELEQQFNNQKITSEDFQKEIESISRKMMQSKPVTNRNSSPQVVRDDTLKSFSQELKETERSTLEKIKKRDENQFDWQTLFKYLGYGIAIFSALYILVKLFTRDKIVEIHEELTQEQKQELKTILRKLPSRFKSFEEEVQQKYKAFHELIEVMHYPTEMFAPPAMIIPIAEEDIPHDGIRAVGNNLGIFFNAINFAGRKKFSANDQKAFRKSFEKFKTYVSKQVD